MSQLPQGLSNTQLELLKIFSYDLPEEELKDLKKFLINFFAQRIRKRTSEIWEERDYTSETMKKWLNEEEQ